MNYNSSITSKLQRLIKSLSSTKFATKVLFLIMGIGSTVWFLVRVIPKPQRAGYPCMKAAAPIMSGFVLYLISLGSSVLFFKKAFQKYKQAKYLTAGFSLLACLVMVVIFNYNDAKSAFSTPNSNVAWTKGVLPDGTNNPMGSGWGIFPGRVAWVRNPDATNENCTNTYTMTGSGWNKKIDWVNSDVFILEKNNNQGVINDMADKSILTIGGKGTVKDSWDAIFKSFNKKKTGTESGYTVGQTIFIKVNNGQAGWAINQTDLSETAQSSAGTGKQNIAMSNTTPATVLAYVRQLVDEVGVPQENIYIGEPMTHVYKSLYDLIHKSYPNVKVLDKENKTSLGRTTSSGWKKDAIVYSDGGDDMPDAITESLMNEMYNADYMINIAALKAHARGGVTMCAKNHFGSHGPHLGKYDSFHLHAGLISTVDNDVLDRGVRGEYGMYRVLTDLSGHEKLGRNTVLFVVDALWTGIEATDMPVKWNIAPFNDDFPSSLFVSQDQVAVESVGLDFLRAEAEVNTYFKNRPFFPAVDDFLHQLADKANWAVTYDPEGDGTEMPASLGVHEHWNNATDKKYSKNLDPTSTKGIELVEIVTGGTNSVANINAFVTGMKVYPNPCTINAEISFTLKENATVEFMVIAMDGKTIQTIQPSKRNVGLQTQKLTTANWAKGNYVVVMKSVTNSKSEVNSIKLNVN